jgi:hypothetical protein
VLAWSLADGSPAAVETGIRHDQLKQFATDRAGRAVVTWSRRGELLLWSAGEGGAFRPSTVAKADARRRIAALALDGSGTRLAVALEGGLELWRIGDGGARRVSSEDAGDVRTVAFSGDGKLVATAGTGLPVQLWNAESGELVKAGASQLPSSRVAALAFAPGTHDLYSVTGTEITRWAPEAGHLAGKTALERLDVVGVALAGPRPAEPGAVTMPGAWADRRGLVAAEFTGGSMAYDVALADPDRGRRRSIATDDAGERLVVTGDEILVWDLRPDSILRAGCALAGRDSGSAPPKAHDPCAALKRAAP